jgi:receptor protein-tyrosine kinase
MGIVVGLVTGLGLGFFREYMDETIRTAEDIKRFTSMPLLGVVPEQKRMRFIWSVDPNDPLYEAYRKILTHMKIMGHKKEPVLQSVLVTSGGPEEGKSTTVINLGISACHTGKTVVVVDADLRRPSLHRCLEVPNDVGLADVLEGGSSVDDAILETSIQGLSVVPGGTPSPDPAKLLGSEKMKALVAGLRDRFELVIVDSAPLLVKTDPLVLSNYVDGSIVVVESGKTTTRAVNELVDMMTKAHVDQVGFVLNKFAVDKGNYY